MEDEIFRFVGLSTDTKPIVDSSGAAIPVGSKFYETDYKNTYIFNGTSWETYITIKYVQEPITFAIEHYLSQFIETVVIQANVNIGDQRFILNAGAGATDSNGQVLEIRYIDPINPLVGVRFYQSEIVAVDDQGTQVVVDCDTPLDFPLNILNIESSFLANVNMAVVGSEVSKIKFTTSPPDNLNWQINGLRISGITDGQPDDGKFFDQPALTWGIFAGFENPFLRKYLVNIKSNADFRATAFDVDYVTRTVPLGTYGVSVRKTFSSNVEYGTTVRLTGATNDEFVLYIQDDLSDITEWRIKVLGREIR